MSTTDLVVDYAPGMIKPSATAKDLEAAILALPLDAPDDAYGEIYNHVCYLKGVIKLLEKLMDQKMVEKIQETGRDIEMGHLRFYVGVERVTKPRDVGKCLMEAIERSNGDIEAAARDFLGASAFRYGSFKRLMSEDQFLLLFSVEDKIDLKEGVAKKKLQKVDTRFQLSSAGPTESE